MTPQDEARRTAEEARKRADNAGDALGESSLARATRHFSGADADPDDRIEIWGRRIGRALSVVFAIYLAWSLLELLGTRR